MGNEILTELITHGREERNIEYKGDVSWKSKDVQAKLVKSILALANIPDGGAIVIGVAQVGEAFSLSGVSDDNLDTFKQDDISAKVNNFADPYVELSVSRVPYDAKNYVVIQVKEFTEIPVICKSDGLPGLGIGKIFTRPRRKIETVQIPSQIEMREILTMAVDKGIRIQQRRLLSYKKDSSDSKQMDDAKFKKQSEVFDK